MRSFIAFPFRLLIACSDRATTPDPEDRRAGNSQQEARRMTIENAPANHALNQRAAVN